MEKYIDFTSTLILPGTGTGVLIQKMKDPCINLPDPMYHQAGHIINPPPLTLYLPLPNSMLCQAQGQVHYENVGPMYQSLWLHAPPDLMHYHLPSPHSVPTCIFTLVLPCTWTGALRGHRIHVSLSPRPRVPPDWTHYHLPLSSHYTYLYSSFARHRDRCTKKTQDPCFNLPDLVYHQTGHIITSLTCEDTPHWLSEVKKQIWWELLHTQVWDLIRFWWPWPNFQGHHTIKTVKISLVYLQFF